MNGRQRMYDTPLRASDLKNHNQNMVLSLIQAAKAEGISQSHVVQKTGLKAPTIFRIFSTLEEEGLITPISQSQEDSNGRKGRRPVFYSVVQNARYTIGLEFWAAFLAVGVFDFYGEQIHTDIHPLPITINAHVLTDLIVSEVSRILEMLNIPREKVIGLGVAAPGQVDLSLGKVRYYPRIVGMKDISLVDELSSRLNIPVLIHNNCSALAFSEYRYGGYEHERSMFTFLLRTGVNGAFVHNDEIYVNSQEQTIECGHLQINTAGPVCTCGNHGCLEAYLQELDPNELDLRLSLFEGLNDKLQKGDEEANKIIEEAATHLVFVIRTLTKLFAPKAFLFVACCQELADAIKHHVGEQLKSPDAFCSEIPALYGTAYNPSSTQRGISDLVLKEYLR